MDDLFIITACAIRADLRTAVGQLLIAPVFGMY